MDKYGAGQDPYCYPGTDILINKLNIKNDVSLEIAERDLTEIAAESIDFSAPPYDFALLKFLHQRLFEDIYTWAGEPRTIDISKGDTRFCVASRILPEAQKLFRQLEAKQWLMDLPKEELIPEIAEFCGDLNVIHPFREGNGRTLRLLCDFIVINSGFEVDWNPVGSDLWMQASIDAVVCDYRKMNQVFELCIGESLSDE